MPVIGHNQSKNHIKLEIKRLIQLVNHYGLSERIKNYLEWIGNHPGMPQTKNERELNGFISGTVSIWWMGSKWWWKKQR